MGLEILKLAFDYNAREQFIYPVILKDESATILVDCGYPGFLPLIEKAAAGFGIALRDLTGLIITHHDLDHMGAAAELKERFPSIKTYASAIDAPYVSGKQKSLRLEQAEAMLATMPEENKQWAHSFIQTLEAMKPVEVDEKLDDGQVLPVCGGVQVIYTPGHMSGHISLLVQQSKTLIAADAMVIEEGKLNIANPQFTLDMDAAIASVRKIKTLDILRIVCYHGGVMESNIEEQLDGLIARYA
jgi:glyoxylase-like metal-dependent hydrolase (beta-lactamase superfamily II)